MFPFKQSLTTANKTPWVNTKEFIIVHHTWTVDGTIKWVLSTLTKGNVSCHFVVDTNGDAYKIWSPDDILWHAGVSEWNGRKNMNNYSLGIEVIGPTNGQFTDEQRATVRKLISHLMAVYRIPNANVLRHRDIAPKRKTDIADSFCKINRLTWKQYQDSLVPKKI